MPLHVIGLGVSEQADLGEKALRALQSAHRVVGSERQLATVRWWLKPSQQIVTLPRLDDLKTQLQASLAQQESVALLASGDPLFYGIGKWVRTTFPEIDVEFHPAISSLQAACHRLGLSLQDVTVVSLHGRPRASLRVHLRAGRDLLVLTDHQSMPTDIARECMETGFDQSELTVCEDLGYEQERIRTFTVSQLVNPNEKAIKFNALHVTCVRVRGQALFLPQFPGIADHHFITDGEAGRGMLSKREVRLSILSLLQPGDGDILWDVGAGCGGVSIELAYWAPKAKVFAIEHHAGRLSCLQGNRERFGVVQNLTVIEGRAPAACSELPTPNKVFIGGSGGELVELLATVWARLPDGGVLVASAVTESTRQTLYGFFNDRQQAGEGIGETLQIAIQRGETLAGEWLYRPNLPVTLYRLQKCQPHGQEHGA